jgi:hypothetical protein
MIKNKEKFEKVYTTLDAYLAGFLALRGHIPQLVNQRGKVVFLFLQSEELLAKLTDYNTGAEVEAARFAFMIKTLKSQIHSMRKNKENFIAKEKVRE